MGFEHYGYGEMGIVQAFKLAVPRGEWEKTLLEKYGEATIECVPGGGKNACGNMQNYPKGTTVRHFVFDGGMLATLFAVYYARGIVINGVEYRRTL